MTPAAASAEIFRCSWSLYDTIVAHDYMAHREIQERVAPVLAGRAAQGPYTLLDLGCGNARWLGDTLRLSPPARYLGVDLSRAALDEAAVHLRALRSVRLLEQDLLACVQGTAPASFDVVYSGFAVHHLGAADKQRLFEAVRAVLTPAGEFLLVDVVREEGQSREQYLENYLAMVRSQWTSLGPEQYEEVARHITAHDFPETQSALEGMAREAGFDGMALLGRFGAHQVLRFARSGSGK
ncbi:MAG: methyltransferase domain-containing protein [Verrucomicrobia bacterium]|nr:methyltransferase domain-containing protein [Verrucomicrobiota bacterium]